MGRMCAINIGRWGYPAVGDVDGGCTVPPNVASRK